MKSHLSISIYQPVYLSLYPLPCHLPLTNLPIVHLEYARQHSWSESASRTVRASASTGRETRNAWSFIESELNELRQEFSSASAKLERLSDVVNIHHLPASQRAGTRQIPMTSPGTAVSPSGDQGNPVIINRAHRIFFFLSIAMRSYLLSSFLFSNPFSLNIGCITSG